MLYAFKTYVDCPENIRPQGIPLTWPWKLLEINEAQAEQQIALGWQVLSPSEYENYIASIQETYNSWASTYKKVPPVVTPRQIRLALVLSGVSLETIATAISAIPDATQRSAASIAWEYSVEFQRNNQLLNTLGPSLGFSASQLDELFILASTL